MARVPYLRPGDLPEADRDLVVSELQGRPLHVYQAIANNRSVLRGLRGFFSSLWTDTGLTERQRELVITATARANDATYEWHQHARIAEGTHLDPAELDAIGARRFDEFGADDRTLLEYATAVATGTVDDADHDAVRAVLDDDATVVGAAATAAGYAGLARLIDALGVEIEPDNGFAGWTRPDGPG